MVFHWFRRDLRLEDNTALELAKDSGNVVQCFFVFDKNILGALENNDPRVSFIYNELIKIDEKLRSMGSSLWIFHGCPIEVNKFLISQYSEVEGIYFNNDYEPYALARDENISDIYVSSGKKVTTSKDHVIFEKNEIVKDDGGGYTVFSPYARKWLRTLKKSDYTKSVALGFPKWNCPIEKEHLLPEMEELGFHNSKIPIPSRIPDVINIQQYDKSRNFPSIENGTSHLGIHLRFGTISIRSLVKLAIKHNEVFLSELIWRDFYQMVLFYHPHSIKKSIKPAYDRIPWVFDESQFSAWCDGKTGYPMVDAGMRELNSTGFMHNRVRMVVASFLTKHLLHDWRLGEAYFAKKLLDFEQASNIGGWQWASGGGCDAAPYFRIFNPTSQLEKFDNGKIYIEKWISELGTPDYPKPLVDHKWARERALRVYKEGLSTNDPML